MKQVFLFAGTTEGRRLARRLGAAGIGTAVSVATEYGVLVLEEAGLGEMGSPAFKDTPDVSEDLKYSSVHVYAFSSLSVLIRAAHVLGKKEAGLNTLYKDQSENMLYLSLYTEGMSKEDALSFVNTLSKYLSIGALAIMFLFLLLYTSIVYSFVVLAITNFKPFLYKYFITCSAKGL